MKCKLIDVFAEEKLSGNGLTVFWDYESLSSERRRNSIMAQIEWDKKYEVGNIEIDSEHKVFIRIIQKIIAAVEKKNYKHTERLINEIYKYADFHFHSEETVMIEIGYPDLNAHKKEHGKLLIELGNRISVFGDDAFIRPMTELITFLTSWFLNHTVTVDKKLANYLKANEQIVYRG